jgi:hypothetical protein
MKPNSMNGESSGIAGQRLAHASFRSVWQTARQLAASFGELPGTQQVGVAEDADGLATGDQFTREQHRFGVFLAHVFEIMEDGDHRPAFAVPAAHQRGQIADGGGIDRPIRLVEQHQRRILKHHPGKQRALQLTSRERPDRTGLETAQADAVDRLGDALAQSAVEAGKGTDLAPQTHGHEVMDDDRKAVVKRRLLRQVGDLPPLDPVQLDAPLQRTQFAGNPLEQRRLAGAVGADDRQQAAGSHFAVQVVHRRMSVVAQGQVVETQQWFGARNPGSVRRCVQSSAQSTVVHRMTSAPAAQSRRDAPLAQSTGFGFARLAETAAG